MFMQKSDILEIRKRFAKEKVTFDNIAGCYVDASKNKLCQFNQSFLNLPEEELFKYLDIAKKSLSGSIGNHMIEYEFPTMEETVGGRQQVLMALRDGYNNDSLLDAYYDQIIENYVTDENYLILIFHDNYDIIRKASDNSELDESEEVYQYLLIAVCPVSLDKPALKYDSDMQSVISRERDLVVGAPEMSVLFPAFTERSTDIHSCLVYHKNPNEVHTEFITECLGCDPIKTASEIREEFYGIIRSNFDNEEQAEKAVLSATRDIHDTIVSQFQEGNRIVELSANDIVDMISEDNRFDESVRASIAEAYDKKFSENLRSDIIVDEGMLKKNEEKLHIIELEDTVAELHEQLNKSDFVNTDTVEISAPDAISDDIQITTVDGKRYICIPLDNIEVFVNGRSM